MRPIDKVFATLIAAMFAVAFYGMVTHNLPLAIAGIAGFNGSIFAWWKLTA